MNEQKRKGCYGVYQLEFATTRRCPECVDYGECLVMPDFGPKAVAVKHDSGKRRLSLIHPSVLIHLLPKRTGHQMIEAAMLNLSEAAHAKDQGEFIQELLDAMMDIRNYAGGGKDALELMAKAMEYGADKPEYGRNNWKKGMAWSRLLDAALRHGLDILNGEDVDTDSGNSHLAHMLGSVHMLLGNYDMRIGTNDIY